MTAYKDCQCLIVKGASSNGAKLGTALGVGAFSGGRKPRQPCHIHLLEINLKILLPFYFWIKVSDPLIWGRWVGMQAIAPNKNITSKIASNLTTAKSIYSFLDLEYARATKRHLALEHGRARIPTKFHQIASF